MQTVLYSAGSARGGIGIFFLDRKKGTLTPGAPVMEEEGISPLALSPDRRFLYAFRNTGTEAVLAFLLDSEGRPVFLNEVPAPANLTYMYIDTGGRFLLGASYGGDCLLTYALGPSGMVQAEPLWRLYPGRNPHCVITDHSNRYAFVPLLGSDRIAQYRFDAASGALQLNSPPMAALPREAGPRHAVLSPDNRYLYLLTEMGGEAAVFALDHETGCLEPLHSVPFLPPERRLPPGSYTPPRNREGGGNSPSPVCWGADIQMTPDGRFLYVTERTNSTLTCLRADPVSGRLDHAETIETEKQPRSINIDPFGEYLIAAGEKSDHVSLYRICRESGLLTHTDRRETGSVPNWLEMTVIP